MSDKVNVPELRKSKGLPELYGWSVIDPDALSAPLNAVEALRCWRDAALAMASAESSLDWDKCDQIGSMESRVALAEKVGVALARFSFEEEA